MRTLILLLIIIWINSAIAAQVKTEKSENGWQLLVNGNPFLVQGVCYLPSKIGESAFENTLRDWMVVDDDKDGINDMAYQSWVDKNCNNIKDAEEKMTGDFQLLKDMGCNTIRVYHHPSSKIKLRNLTNNQKALSHAPNKKLLRKLHKDYGIWTIMGDLLGAYGAGSGAPNGEETDYLNPTHRRNMMTSVKDMVIEFKDEPYILMWTLGNENNYQHLTRNNCAENPEAFARFLNKMARMIHKLDPNHPVCLVNGGVEFIGIYAKYARNVDIFGLNEYSRSTDFGNLWDQVAQQFDRPVLITEFGDDRPQFIDVTLNQDSQAQIYRNHWVDILEHTSGRGKPGNAIGGIVFEFLDNWWQDGNPNIHDISKEHSLEWRGICSQGDGSDSPLLRQPRKSYYYLKKIWSGNAE